MLRNTFVRKISSARPALSQTQKRHKGIPYDISIAFGDNPPPNMDSFRASMAEHAKSVIFKHEIRGRRNNETIDSLHDSMKAAYAKTAPYKFCEEDENFIEEYLGFSKEEIRLAQDYDAFDTTMWNYTGDRPTPNWDKFREHLGAGSDVMVKTLNSMEDHYNAAIDRTTSGTTQAEVDEVLKDIYNPDWSILDGKVSKRAIEVIQREYFKLVDEFIPDVDSNEVRRLTAEQIERALEEFCDTMGERKKVLIDYNSEQICRFGPVLERDEKGNLVHDFESFAFIDTFFPEVRDMMMKEMSVENYRMEFPYESKKYNISYEDVIQRAHKHSFEQSLKAYDASVSTHTATTKRGQELQKQLQNVLELMEEAAALSRDTKSDEPAKKDDKKKKTDTTTEQDVQAVSKAEAEKLEKQLWASIEEQTGQTKDEIFGGRSTDFEPLDINAMLDAEEEAEKNKA